jgi:nitrate/nitrite transport system substrate-binding protein
VAEAVRVTCLWQSGSVNMNFKKYYAAFLDLEHKCCLVVGGATVAERKVWGLLDATADVVVVSPSLTDTLRQWAVTGVIRHIGRALCDADVEGCVLAIGATDRPEVNAGASGLPLLAATPSSRQGGSSQCHADDTPPSLWTEQAGSAETAVMASERSQRPWQTQRTRRNFLTASTTGALALLLAGLPRGWVGGVYAGDGPEAPKVRISIIALTDCSSIVMAHELGLFKKYGIESTISKEASWAVIRDRLSLGENQATHFLLGIPYASTMGLLGSPVKPMIIPFYLNRSGQAITLTKDPLVKRAKTPQALKPLAEEAKRAGKPMTFAVTFPPGTHAMWMRYSLAVGGINPDKDVTLITIPPPQMVANMKVGKMDAFCVGEPWNARAIADGIGFTAITTQQIWRDHPEKVLGFTEEFADKNPKTVKALLRALLEASQYLDKLENRPHVAEVVARPQYINTQKEVIAAWTCSTMPTINDCVTISSRSWRSAPS